MTLGFDPGMEPTAIEEDENEGHGEGDGHGGVGGGMGGVARWRIAVRNAE